MCDLAASWVLVVDDDDAFHTLMRALLERGGFLVDDARDGAEAIAKLRVDTILSVVSVCSAGLSESRGPPLHV